MIISFKKNKKERETCQKYGELGEKRPTVLIVSKIRDDTLRPLKNGNLQQSRYVYTSEKKH